VGEARRSVVELCHGFGGDETFTGKAAIVATEMARNIVRHGDGGEFVIRESVNGKDPCLDLLAIDRGRGMRNLAEALRDGYSTIGTAGNGLGSIKRMADSFEIYSLPERGTVVWARLCLHPEAGSTPGGYSYGGVNVALEKEEICGDAWDVLMSNGSLRLLVADGLGHGPFAADAAREALDTFRSNQTTSPSQTLELAHQALTKTRGASAAIVEVQTGRSRVSSAGIGNISMRLIDREKGSSKSFICENGTLGIKIRRIQEFDHPLVADWLLVMHTDGLGSQWSTESYPGLTQRHPELIAGVLYRDFKRDRDDVTVVVAKQMK
jgi:anti-sigma regulatory factor (Ser/Thr protein kinase)